MHIVWRTISQLGLWEIEMSEPNRAAIQSRRCQEALEALYGPPLSEDEIAHYNRLRAEEMARAERHREPSPQLALERRDA